MLRPYQQTALDQCRASFAAGNRAVLLVLPTGGGKTVLGASVVAGAIAKGRRVLWVAGRRELIDQAAARMPVTAGVVMAGRKPDYASPVQVASIDSIMARGEYPPADLVVYDECFPAGTMVDDRPIESVRVGDEVRSVDAFGRPTIGRVSWVFKSRARSVVRVRASCYSVVATPNHPFWTMRGWVRAADLKETDHVYVPSVQVVSERSCLLQRPEEQRPVQDGSGLLLVRLQETLEVKVVVGNDAPDQPCSVGSVVAKNEGAQPDALCRVPDQDVGDAEVDGPHASVQRGEWDRNDRASINDVGGPGVVVCSGVCGPDGDEARRGRDAKSLQDRPGVPGHHAGDRDRRAFPFISPQEGVGPTEGSVPGWVRVDRVEVHERGGSPEFDVLCPNADVYNLEVEGTHVYFANGFLVHNCHHIVSRTSRQLLDHYPGAHVLGLTATPERADGTALGDVFDEMVVGVTVRELMDQGHLVECDCVGPADESSALAQDPVKAWLDHSGGRPGFVFAKSVTHSQRIVDGLKSAGVMAAHVDGSTAKGRRDELIEGFRKGRVDVLSSVYVFSEGTDIPRAAVCLMARGFAHASSYLQCVGRVLRPSPGKDRALLIDLTGGVHTHGLVDDERIWSLDGESHRLAARAMALSQCPSCGAVWRSNGKPCPVCGFEMPPPPAPKIEERPLEDLRERLRPALLPNASPEKRDAKWSELVALGRDRGYKDGWAKMRYKAIFGCWRNE